MGIFTRPVVALILAGGAWSTLANLAVFLWALHNGHGIGHAMTLTFVSLVLIQFFKAYNFRSDRRSILHAPFANKWLNRAILWELLLLVSIVYVPFLHAPFGTASLTAGEWAVAAGVATTVVPVLELAKWMIRRGWFGEVD